VESLLPFDVEVHQLSSGQRMVLDTHRLLIPDVSWIDWVESSEEAKPRVWAIVRGHAGVVNGGRLDLEYSTKPNLDTVQSAIVKQFETVDHIAVCGAADLCDITPQSVSGSGVLILSSGASSGAELEPTAGGTCFVVSCPGWFWGKASRLTCLLTPEAAAVLKACSPDGVETSGGLIPSFPSPDEALSSSDGDETCRAACKALLRASIGVCRRQRWWPQIPVEETSSQLRLEHAAHPKCVGPGSGRVCCGCFGEACASTCFTPSWDVG